MDKLSVLALAMMATSGCIPFWLFDDDDDEPPSLIEPVPSPPAGDVSPPAITDIRVPEWPPLGPYDIIEVSVRDDQALARLDVQFMQGVSLGLAGTSTTALLSATELGEGYGSMTFTLFDAAGLSDSEQLGEVLIDLTPPEYQVGNTVLRPDSQLELTVTDSWALGAVELLVGGAFLVHDFDDAYPATLGIEWDSAEIAFPMSDVPPGTWAAALRVIDAAGNATEDIFTLTVDAQPPTVQILSPSEGATISGPFEVSVEGSDPEGPVWLTLLVDGNLAASVSGPLATVPLAAPASGTHTIEAIASDQAGNQSSAVIHIDVP